MLKPAFSTVACPEWTLSEVADRASACGFEAVELRTFGVASSRFACDPALTDGEKVRRIFSGRGVEILSLATGVSLEEPVNPPVIGWAISDTERSVRAARWAIDLAVAIECPLVRVFGFDIPAREDRSIATARIAKRLAAVADHAHNTGIRVVIENGGGFRKASEVVELVTAAASPLVGVSYSLPVGVDAGDSLEAALDALGDRLWVARFKDLNHGQPVPLGEGQIPCEQFTRELLKRGFSGPLVYEWDRAWRTGLAPAEVELAAASARVWGWLGGRVPVRAARAPATGQPARRS